MNGKELLKKLVNEKEWYGKSMTKNRAANIKYQLLNGSISETTITTTLLKLGYVQDFKLNKNNMKKQVSDFVKSLGGTTAYSGKEKTMFINDNTPHSGIEEKVVNQFGYGLPFKLKTNKE